MGKASRTKHNPDRRARIAAQRAAARRAEQRRRLFLALGAIVVVVLVVGGFFVFKGNGSSSSGGGSNGPTGAALTSVINQTTSVPASNLNTVGDGGAQITGKPVTISGNQPPLTSDNKPEMLYMGAEYCPYCAAERWGMVVALSRFGTFTGLSTVHSASVNGGGSSEPDPNTPTWTFAKAKFTSKYLTFTPVEMQTNIPDPATKGYTNLQTPTSAQQALITKYDAPPYTQQQGSIPFIDFGNKYLISGSSYDPGLLAGKSWAQVASALNDPSTPIAKAILGTANYMTAAICKLTGNQPTTACTPAVTQLESKI
jgi:hypothetical protein